MQSRFNEFRSTVDSLYTILNNLNAYEKELSNKLSDYDKHIIDIEHCIELERLSASQLIQVVVKQREVLIERRKVKQELELVQNILKTDPNIQNTIKKLNDVKSGFMQVKNAHETKVYSPRIDSSLFSAKTITKEKPQVKEQSDKQPSYSTNNIAPPPEYIPNNKQLEYIDYKGKKRKISGGKSSLDKKFEQISKSKH